MANIFQYLTFTDPNTLLTTVLLPFILIFVIIWGVLNMTRIFGNSPEGRKINVVIAAVITIFAAFTDAWGVIAGQLAAFTGIFVFVIFFAMIIIGAVMWAIGKNRRIYNIHVSQEQRFGNMKRINKQLEELYKKRREADHRGDMDMVGSVEKAISELEKKRDRVLVYGDQNSR